MREYYKLTFPITDSKRSIIQKLLLIAAILLDIYNLFVFIDSVLGNRYFFILFVFIIILSTVLRVISTRLNYSYIYIFNGGMLTIIKSYSLRSIKVLTLSSVSDFELIENGQQSSDKRLYNPSCDFDKYIIKFEGKSYKIALDAYMFTLITTKIKEES